MDDDPHLTRARIAWRPGAARPRRGAARLARCAGAEAVLARGARGPCHRRGAAELDLAAGHRAGQPCPVAAESALPGVGPSSATSSPPCAGKSGPAGCLRRATATTSCRSRTAPFGQERKPRGRLRAALPRLRPALGERVPGQLLHYERPALPRGGLGLERELRRRLVELWPGRERLGSSASATATSSSGTASSKAT